jgi:hypothetical protein
MRMIHSASVRSVSYAFLFILQHTAASIPTLLTEFSDAL